MEIKPTDNFYDEELNLTADVANEDACDEEEADLYEHYRVVADKGQQLMRVDKFLMDHLKDTSRNRIQMAAKAGFIHVNGQPVKSNYRVKPADVVTMLLDRTRYENLIEPENIPLDVVYEDSELMVINKPAGLVVHPGCGNYTGTLVNAIAWHLTKILRDCLLWLKRLMPRPNWVCSFSIKQRADATMSWFGETWPTTRAASRVT